MQYSRRKRGNNLQPTYGGEHVPYAIIMKPTELMLVKGENGSWYALCIHQRASRPCVEAQRQKRVGSTFQMMMTVFIHPIVGTGSAYALWNWDDLN